jgi:uncharacterized protein
VAAGFDCSKAKSPTEQRICADPMLARMDREMSDAYQRLLKTAPQADVWKADQRAWLVQRDGCKGDDGCLRSTYAERLAILRTGGRPFRWNAHWWRVDADGNAPSELVVSKVTKQGFAFDVNASAGANTGELSGSASLVAADTARYRGDAASDTEGCMLTFKRVLNHLNVEQKGDSPTCAAGLNVYYSGVYVAADHDPNVAPDLVSRGVLPSRELDEAFRAMVGDDYGKFVDAADVVGSEQATLNGKPVTAVGMFVRGIACYSHGTIAFDGHGHLWAALLYIEDGGDDGKSELRYYTNVAVDKHKLPDVFAHERKDCRGDVPVRMMP